MEYDELKRLMDGQKDEMTAAERMKAYNAGEEVDYIPYTLQAPDPAIDVYKRQASEYREEKNPAGTGGEAAVIGCGLNQTALEMLFRRKNI